MAGMWPVLLVPLVFSPSVSGKGFSRQPPQFAGLQDIKMLASAGGSSATNFEVVTEDGYYLWLHRLGNNSGLPVLLVHGLPFAADVWIARNPRKSLPFLLLERGYDVWLPNLRGTVNNERHVMYPRSDRRFWDFSFHESGYYDIPAFINKILAITGREKLFYVGHSQGTAVFLAMASTRPEYNTRVAAAVLLSPVAFPPTFAESSPAVKLFISFGDSLVGGLRLLGQYELGRRTEASISFLKNFCGEQASTQKLCFSLIGLIFGNSESTVDKAEWDQYEPYFGAGLSLKTVNHFLQIFKTGEFKEFDYGPKTNLIRYCNKNPPKYKLDLIAAPVALIWSQNDPLLSRTSVAKLASRLPNLIFSKTVADPLFTHADMYIGANADKLVYSDVIGVLNSFSPIQETTSGESNKFLRSQYLNYQGA